MNATIPSQPSSPWLRGVCNSRRFGAWLGLALALSWVAPQIAGARRRCKFGPGARPEETLRRKDPRGDQIPINHILVLMQENRSFDHYFGRLRAFGHRRVRGLPRHARNPDADGKPVRAFHQTLYCHADVEHSWNNSHAQYNGGRNNGFVTTNNPDGARAMGYYDETDLPFYYGLADVFAIADRYFSSVLGPTFPNRFFLLAATSDGRIRNDLVAVDRPTIFGRLDDAGVSWKVYASDLAFALLLSEVFPSKASKVVGVDDYFVDAAAGNLPAVAFVDPRFFGDITSESDEHPPANPQIGQQFVASVVHALIGSPQWPDSALFITYDEHGGFYDHVRPPRACPPDDVPAELQPGDTEARFDRYGFRVPLILVSPYARPHFVSHRVYDHTSILRFIETRFDLPALTARDANARPMLRLFDFSHPQLLTPPALPEATLDPARLQRCIDDFGPPPANTTP